MRHTCHAFACETACAPKLLFCARHWLMVPGDLREPVLAHYRPGQERDRRPSARYMGAALRAKAYVARREGHEKAAVFLDETAARWERRAAG